MRRLLASWFGTGLILGRIRGSDDGSGTVGSLLALAIALAVGRLGWGWQLAAAVVVTGLSVWASHGFSDPGSDHADPGWVVVDEAAGTFVATIGLGAPASLAGWAGFRLADIFKDRFPGVRKAEQLPGGWGITADDLVAGIYGLILGWLVQAALG